MKNEISIDGRIDELEIRIIALERAIENMAAHLARLLETSEYRITETKGAIL